MFTRIALRLCVLVGLLFAGVVYAVDTRYDDHSCWPGQWMKPPIEGMCIVTSDPADPCNRTGCDGRTAFAIWIPGTCFPAEGQNCIEQDPQPTPPREEEFVEYCKYFYDDLGNFVFCDCTNKRSGVYRYSDPPGRNCFDPL